MSNLGENLAQCNSTLVIGALVQKDFCSEEAQYGMTFRKCFWYLNELQESQPFSIGSDGAWSERRPRLRGFADTFISITG